jgi:hypothetical protein
MKRLKNGPQTTFGIHGRVTRILLVSAVTVLLPFVQVAEEIVMKRFGEFL